MQLWNSVTGKIKYFSNGNCTRVHAKVNTLMNEFSIHVWYSVEGIFIISTTWLTVVLRFRYISPRNIAVIVIPDWIVWLTTTPFKTHDDVIKWKHFPRYWSFVRGIHRLSVNSPHKGQWRGALMFSFICAWINGWVNNRKDGDLRRHRAHYDVIVMLYHQSIHNVIHNVITTICENVPVRICASHRLFPSWASIGQTLG